MAFGPLDVVEESRWPSGLRRSAGRLLQLSEAGRNQQ
jgi:hypothetical protein